MKLIYAANLHKGGSVQVAASFIDEAAKLDIAKNYDLVLSDRVLKDLVDANTSLKCFASYRIVNHYGLSLSSLWFSIAALRYSKIFIIFGPKYYFSPFAKCMCGFAQPWIIYPNNLVCGGIRILDLARMRLKYLIQKILFFRCQLLVVELPHVRDELVKLGFPLNRIVVVHNCISGVFLNASRWKKVSEAPSVTGYRIGVIGRNYLHKNIDMIGRVGTILRRKSGLNFKFVLTLTDKEFESLSQESRECSISVGEITISQCPEFYRMVDCVFFPSLLECFSATPIEAMFMGKSLIISDLPFNRDVCEECGFYFDPLNPESAADQIVKVFMKQVEVLLKISLGKTLAEQYINSAARAHEYIESFEKM
jgi:glycosyltransferase involved in cell wall biosynthesis